MMLNAVSRVRSTPAAAASTGASTNARFAAGPNVATVAFVMGARKKTHTISATDKSVIKTTRNMNQRFVTARCFLIASASRIMRGSGVGMDIFVFMLLLLIVVECNV